MTILGASHAPLPAANWRAVRTTPLFFATDSNCY